MIKDIGKLLGILFIVIGSLQIIGMIINQQLTGNINIQFSSLIYFIAGYYLYNHNEKARKIIMVFMGMIMLIQFSAFIYFTLNGIPEGAQARLWGVGISNIINLKFIPFVFLFSIIIPAIPFFLLRSKQAIVEFSDTMESNNVDS